MVLRSCPTSQSFAAPLVEADRQPSAAGRAASRTQNRCTSLSVPKTRFGRIGDVVHREQDVTLGRQGAESDDAPARLC
jgi:hypothetical protein